MSEFNRPTVLTITQEKELYVATWNSALEMAAYKVENEFIRAFGKDTLSSMAIYIRSLKYSLPHNTLLYITPPQRTWVGLTDDEIDSCFENHGWSPSEDYYPVIKDIEAKLKEKNT